MALLLNQHYFQSIKSDHKKLTADLYLLIFFLVANVVSYHFPILLASQKLQFNTL